jgi:hypothetical protein
MDPRQLEIANLAAEYNFGKTELVGYYHNEAVNYIVQKLPGGSRKNSSGQITRLGEKYFLSLSEKTFGKISRKNYEAIIRESTEANCDPKNVSLVWKNNSALSEKANKKMAKLFNLLRSVLKRQLSVKEIKEALVGWQKAIGKLSETEFVVLSAAGSVARHSAAYWVMNEPVTNPGSIAGKRTCKHIMQTICADILFAVVGAISGAAAGGPVGAVVGAVTFGGRGSALIFFAGGRGK